MWSSDAEASAHGAVDWVHVAGQVIGGVALLCFSMSFMSRSLRAAFGTSLRAAIRAACYNRVTAFLTGTVATAALTSATATSLLTLSFVQAGDMTLAQALGVSLGINVGSTLNAHLVAIQVQRYGMALLGIGYIVSVIASRAPRWAHVGESLIGLGLLFASISAISEGIAPLRHYKPFLALLAHMSEQRTLSMLTAAICAVLFQSSNTVIAVAIMLGQQGFLPLETALLFVLGANVGTCLTSVIAALGQRRDAMRVAIAYLLLKAVGVALLLPLLPQLLWLLDASTAVAKLRAEEHALADAVSDGLFVAPATVGGGGSGAFSGAPMFDSSGRASALLAAGAASADGDDGVAGIRTLEAIRESARRAVLPVQIANAHTLVNLFIALLFMPLLDYVARFMGALVPDDGAVGKREGEGSSTSLDSDVASSSNDTGSSSANSSTYGNSRGVAGSGSGSGHSHSHGHGRGHHGPSLPSSMLHASDSAVANGTSASAVGIAASPAAAAFAMFAEDQDRSSAASGAGDFRAPSRFASDAADARYRHPVSIADRDRARFISPGRGVAMRDAGASGELAETAVSHQPAVEPSPGLLATVGRLFSFVGGGGGGAEGERGSRAASSSNAAAQGAAGRRGAAVGAGGGRSDYDQHEDEDDEEAAAAAYADSTPFLMRQGAGSRTDDWHTHSGLAATGAASAQPFADRLSGAAAAGSFDGTGGGVFAASGHSFTSGAAAMPRSSALHSAGAAGGAAASGSGSSSSASDFGGPIDYPSLMPPLANAGAPTAASRLGTRKR